jgi:protein-disulfide isomerase
VAAGTHGHGHVRGAPDARVTLEMFGNYECLHCRRAWPAVLSTLAALGDDVRFVYRHFARPADFPHAELAAEAAEAAAAQGRFWPMHDLLMTEAPALHAEVLMASAVALGLDRDAVREALASHAFRGEVRAQLAEGLARGVRSTPTFYIDGEPFTEPWDLDALGRALRDAVGASAAP